MIRVIINCFILVSIQYFFCIDPVIRISKFCLYTADLSALPGSHRKYRKLVLHNICRIRDQHHMHLDIRITLFKILHCIQILFQITFICHSNIFHQIMILSFENTTFFCPPRHTVRKCLDSYPGISSCKLIRYILLVLLHKPSGSNSGKRNFRFLRQHTHFFF